MLPENIAWLYRINDGTLKANTEEITHEESLRRPEPGGNCINWVVGHLLRSRQWLLTYLEVPWEFPAEKHEFYRRGSSGDGFADFLNLEELMLLWDESQKLIAEALPKLTPERMASQAPPLGDFPRADTLERRLFFIYFHEVYHLGQLGLMRRLLGKEGAIQ